MDDLAPDIPISVLYAMQITFTGGVTAFLYRPQIWGFSLAGTVYRDARCKFQNGRVIRTSSVNELHQEHGYLIAITNSGSRYVLIDHDPQQDSPLWVQLNNVTVH